MNTQAHATGPNLKDCQELVRGYGRWNGITDRFIWTKEKCKPKNMTTRVVENIQQTLEHTLCGEIQTLRGCPAAAGEPAVAAGSADSADFADYWIQEDVRILYERFFYISWFLTLLPLWNPLEIREIAPKMAVNAVFSAKNHIVIFKTLPSRTFSICCPFVFMFYTFSRDTTKI